MDALIFHPKMVHVPMALAVLMPLIAGGVLLAWWRGWLPGRAWVLAVALQGVLAVSGIVAMRSGEAEEDRVEQVVPERFIEEHEDAAKAFVFTSVGVLAAMAAALAFRSRRGALTVAAASTVGTIAVLALGYRTGQAGGSLVYDQGAAQAYVKGPAAVNDATPSVQREREDDD